MLSARFAGCLLALALAGGSAAALAPSSASELAVSRNLVLIDAKTGAVDTDFPDAYGGSGAYLVTADGRGGWYVGGDFTRVGDDSRKVLVHLRSDGSLDPNFKLAVPRRVFAAGNYLLSELLFRGGVVYIAGDIGSHGELGVAALDSRTGERLWWTRIKPWDSQINDLAFGGSVLYVSGPFTRVGDVSRTAIAALDPRTGKPTAWRIRLTYPSYMTIAAVGPVAVGGGKLFFYGDFARINGVRGESGLAAIDLRTGSPIS
ncbi:MAG TPA: PQQ-binding-like beta-propeller repeat protein [Gaiellaceae bacterium]